MSTFVMTDIHGCYDAMRKMLDQIGFSGKDHLICAGDYIDRGPQNYEMLRWLEKPDSNVTLVRGNHDEQFAYYVELMKRIFVKKELDCIFYDLDCGYVYKGEEIAGASGEAKLACLRLEDEKVLYI